MSTRKTIVMFPGQGAYDGPALAAAQRRYPQVAKTFEIVDQVAEELFARRLTDILFVDAPPAIATLLADEPWVSQLAIYGAGAAAYQVLTDEGLRPDGLIGHSLGEIVALVSAGAYTIEDGARIVAERVRAIHEHGPPSGRMAALATDAARAARIIELVDDPLLAVASENHDRQTVVSGPAESLERVLGVAALLRIGAVELHASLPFHTPALAAAAPVFADRVRGLRQRPLEIPVYSPILQRYYRPDDGLADALAEHFTRPVRFAAGIRGLHREGARVFVESGALATLTNLIGKIIEDPATWAGATMFLDRAGELAIGSTVARLRALGALGGLGGGLSEILNSALAPGLSPELFAGFWARHGAEIVRLTEARLGEFQSGRASTVGSVTDAAAAFDPPPVATPEAGPEPAGAPVDREVLGAAVRELYAQALEYPEEVFTEDVLLEAELGVDSVKQVELLGRVSQRYGLPPRDNGFRLADHDTIGKITDFLCAALQDRAAVPVG